MKAAWLIIILAVAFALGWFLRGPGEIGAAADPEEAQTPVKAKSEGDDEIDQAKSDAMRARVEAIYRGEEPISADDRLALLKEINQSKGLENKGLQMRLLIVPMNEDELVAAIQEALAQEESEAPVYLLFSRWAELNRNAAFTFYLQYRGDRKKVRSLGRSALNNWVNEDVEGALSALESVPEDERDSLANSMIWSAMHTSYPLALQLQQRIGQPGQTHIYDNLFERWSREDPQAAWAAIGDIPPGKPTEQAMRGFFKTIAKTDVESALSYAEAVPSHDIRKESLRTIYNEWLKTDPEAALESAGQLDDLENFFHGWNVPQDAREPMLDWAFKSLDGNLQDNLVSSLLGRMAQDDPQAALKYIESLPVGQAYESAMSGLARNWANSDPEAAIEFFSKLPPGKEKRDRMENILSAYADDDPEAAKAFYLSLDERTRQEAADNLARGLVRGQNPEEALAWARSIQDESLRQDLEKEVYEQWASEDPWTFFNAITPEQYAGMDDDTQRDTLNSWARSSPQEAANWIDNMPEEKQKDAIDRVSEQWLRHDPYEASIWIADLPEGDGRDEAVYNLVNNIHRGDPASALDWSVDIQDEGKRRNAAGTAIRQWLTEDYDGAHDALLASDFPQEDIDYLAKRYFKKEP